MPARRGDIRREATERLVLSLAGCSVRIGILNMECTGYGARPANLSFMESIAFYPPAPPPDQGKRHLIITGEIAGEVAFDFGVRPRAASRRRPQEMARRGAARRGSGD